jgi:anaerobic ribonucleoside-triphosphate reductase
MLQDQLAYVNKDNVLDIVDDLQKYLHIISLIFNIGPRTTSDSAAKKQHELTAKYVERFKDDKQETIASQVIERVHGYLSAFMNNKDINCNQIGQDLVELGVKKTRKSRGYVYNVMNPSQQELRKFTYEALSTP